MSWRTDTTNILADTGPSSVLVLSATYNLSVMPSYASGSGSFVESATVQVFPARMSDGLEKDDRGFVIPAQFKFYFPYTTSVAVTHKIYDGGTAYYEVLRRDDYQDHKRVIAKRTNGR